MPIYEFGCRSCARVTEYYTRKYEIPASVKCSSCGSSETVKLISLTNYRFPQKHKYSDDFVEKSLPFLKSRKELKGMFEADTKESDESKAMKVSDQIGQQIDRVIHKQLKDMNK